MPSWSSVKGVDVRQAARLGKHDADVVRTGHVVRRDAHERRCFASDGGHKVTITFRVRRKGNG